MPRKNRKNTSSEKEVEQKVMTKSETFLKAIEEGNTENAEETFVVGSVSALDVWNATLRCFPWNSCIEMDKFIMQHFPLEGGLSNLENLVYAGRFELLKFYLKDTVSFAGNLVCLKHHDHIAKYLVKNKLVNFDNFDVRDWVFSLKQGRISFKVFQRILDAYHESVESCEEKCFHFDMNELLKFTNQYLTEDVIEYLIKTFVNNVNIKSLLRYSKNRECILEKLKDVEITEDLVDSALQGHQSPDIVLKLGNLETIWKHVLEKDISKFYSVDELKEILKDSPPDLAMPLKNQLALIAYYELHGDEINADQLFKRAINKFNKLAALVITDTKTTDIANLVYDVVENENKKVLTALLDAGFTQREQVRELLYSSNNDYVNKQLREAIEIDAKIEKSKNEKSYGWLF